MFSKLLPREGNFFELFNQHGDYLVEGAHAFLAIERVMSAGTGVLGPAVAAIAETADA